MLQRISALAAALLASAVLLSGQRFTAADAPPLFEIQPAGPGTLGRGGQVPVRVRFDLAADAAARGGAIGLPLTYSTFVTGSVTYRQAGGDHMVLAGPLTSGADGEFHLSFLRGAVTGRIVHDGRVFLVRRAPESDLHIVEEADATGFPPEGEPRTPPPDPDVDHQRAAADVPAAAGDADGVMDVLLVYTPSARLAAGGTGQIQGIAQAAVDVANTSLANAGLSQRFRLVHTAEVQYSESGSFNTDLDRLTSRVDGFIDQVHAMRDGTRADFVGLLTNDPGMCGLAWVMPSGSISVTAFQSSAFSVTGWSCAAGNITLAHEIGHNLGLDHDSANAGGARAFPYAFGFRVPGFARDLMSYECERQGLSRCDRRAIYSTPLRPFPGSSIAAGTATEDTARAIGNTAPVAANFRDSTCSYTVSPLDVTVRSSGTTSTIDVSTGAGCAWAAISNTPDIVTVTANSTRTGGGSTTFRVGSTVEARTGSLGVAGQTVTIRQQRYIAPPVIGLHPRSQAVNRGAEVWFSVSVEGESPITYSWEKNQVPIPHTDGPDLILRSVDFADEGTYRVVVTNGGGSVTSNGAALTVNRPPSFVAHPASQTVDPGTKVELRAAIMGTAPVYIEWRKNGAVIPGKHGETLAFDPVRETDEGSYAVYAQNVAGTATSNAATLTVNDPVRISAQPASAAVARGAAVTFQVTATGTGPLTYQWRRNDVAIAGATGASLAIGATGGGDVGRYTVAVTNRLGTVVSNEAILALPGAYYISTLAGVRGSAGATDGVGAAARLTSPRQLTLHPGGDIYFASKNGIRRVSPSGEVSSTGLVAQAEPFGLVFDQQGILYFTAGHSVVRQTGATTTTPIAGHWLFDGAVDGSGTTARFRLPWGLARDAAGNIYVAERDNQTIRKIAGTAVTTVAGTFLQVGTADGTGAAARFAGPQALAIDAAGNLFIGDTGNHAIRRMTPSGVVTTFAGLPGHTGRDDGVGTAARFVYVWGLAFDPSGNLFVASNQTLRMVTPDGRVTTIAGSLDTTPLSGTGDGIADAARIAPEGIVVDGAGTIYFSEMGNHTIRKAVVAQPPVVTRQPPSHTVTTGHPVEFTVTATGMPVPDYRWQYSADGGASWNDLSDTPTDTGSTTPSIRVSTDIRNQGRLFRCVVSNAAGWAISEAGRLTLNTLSVDRSRVHFTVVRNTASGAFTAVTPGQAVTLAYVGSTPRWTATADKPWVRITPASGTGAARFTVTVDPAASGVTPSVGVASQVTVSDAALNTRALLTVSLSSMDAGPSVKGPFGQVDTPAQASDGAVGAIAVSGWALDDVGVTSVKVYRNCLAFEPAANCQTVLGHSVVYVGDAAFLDGARPDVEAAFHLPPQNHRAGWGYLMMTSMLPDVPAQQPYGGRGPLSLYAVASDVEGNMTLLGRSVDDHTPTSITLANDGIAKPFGAIDTPGQGETVSGILHNFGWALTPDTDSVAGNGDIVIPPNGSTMVVFIDGQPAGTVSFNQCRGSVGNPVPAGVFCNDDVANIFGSATPQPPLNGRSSNPTRYRNLDAGRAAIGVFTIDTTKLTNGLHTIAWSVTDSAGRTEGIGSRFFIVLNGGPADGPRR